MTYHLPTRFNAGLSFGSSRLDSLFDRVFNDSLFSAARHFTVDETDEAYSFELELPGFKQEHLDVTLDDTILTVSAKRESRTFEQSVIVPAGVDPEKIEAKLEDGLLRITLGKSPLIKPRKIAVK